MRNNQVVRNVTVTTIQIATSAATLFLTYRYLVRAIGIEAIGVWSVVLAITSVGRLADLGLSGSTTRFVARAIAQGGPPLAVQYAQTTALLAAGLYLCLALLAYPILGYVLHVVVPVSYLPVATALIPYALASFWLGGVTAVLFGAIDGTHRIDLKGLLIMAGAVLYLGLILILVPGRGLMGLAYAQVLQAMALLVSSWLLLRRCLAGLPMIPKRWASSVLREIIGFGSQLQLISIMVVLSEPVTKALLSRFGGLAAAGYYEMATRMVQQVRGLLVNANQVLVPTIADLQERNVESVPRLYDDSYRVMVFLSLPMFTALVALTPLISDWWVGRLEPRFVLFAVLLGLAWLVNAISAPAYFSGMARGRIRWNLAGHVTQAGLNVILGAFLGILWGGVGVVAGAATALIAGSMVTILGYHTEQAERLMALFPRESARLAVVCLAVVVAAFAAYYLLRLRQQAAPGVVEFLTLLVVLPTLTWFVWQHPLRERLVSWAFSSGTRTDP